MSEQRVAVRREACRECPTLTDYRCGDHAIVANVGKWWIRITGTAIILFIPLLATFLVFVAQIDKTLAVTSVQLSMMMKTLEQNDARIGRLEAGRQR